MPGTRRRAPRRRVALLALVTASTLLASACTVGPSRRPAVATAGTLAPSSSPTSPLPTGPGGPGRRSNPIGWVGCPASVPTSTTDGARYTVDCGGVVVPVSYSDANQGSFALRVARATANGTPADAPPLVVLRGDPGQNGRGAVAAVAASLPTEIQHRYAVITVDLRGTGNSSGIDCVSDTTLRTLLGLAADPSSDAGGDQVVALARELTFDCGDLVGPSLTQFNSTNAADDLDTLRAALGVPALTVLGTGYGATIAAVYANRYPGRVQAMVLDSPTDPLTPPDRRAIQSASAAQNLLADFAAACPGFDGGCPLGDDPAGTVTDLVSRLANSGDAAGKWVMTGGSVLLALLELLPEQQGWPDLARAIAGLQDGDAQPLADLLTSALGGDRLSERWSGRLVYQCNDNAQRLTGTSLTDAVTTARPTSPLFGPFAVTLAALCGSWPAADDPLGRISAAGAAPILIVGSVKNPLHPYAGAQSLAGQLASGVLVTWQSGRDGAYPASACVASTVNAYLLHGTVPPIGQLCPP